MLLVASLEMYNDIYVEGLPLQRQYKPSLVDGRMGKLMDFEESVAP